MSLFSAMNTAVSGLTAQSAAFSNISDNVANSQTVGYKEVDTSFIDYLTTSSANEEGPHSVVAQPDYQNNVQGTITQSTNPLNLAISGQGFFQVSQPTSLSGSATTFSTTPYYTRAGDFQVNANGYLVNSAGNYLNGWSVNPTTGAVDETAVAPIQVNEGVYQPVATANVTLAANLPATPAAGSTISSQATIYDTLGTAHTVTLGWTQTATDVWSVAVTSPDDVAAAARGTATVDFGPTTSGNPVSDGTIGAVNGGTGSVTTGAYSTNGVANLTFSTDFGEGAQTVTLNLGNYGETNGVTQYAGSTYTLGSLTQDGVPPGSFSSVTTTSAGDVVVNYNNGQSRTVAQVPLTTFADPNALQQQDGQAYTATTDSGTPITNASGANGAGKLVTDSVEQSNVDIATQFTQLIVAQQAYSANAKVVTTANNMLQTTLDMKQ